MTKYDHIVTQCVDACVDFLGCPAASATLNARICDDLGADSLDHLELCILLEERFGVYIETDDASRLVTVGDVADLIVRKLAVLPISTAMCAVDATGQREGIERGLVRAMLVVRAKLDEISAQTAMRRPLQDVYESLTDDLHTMQAQHAVAR